jgi:hypothetical protein
MNAENRNSYRILVGKPEGKNHQEDRDLDGWLILKWILERYAGVVWTGLICLRIGTSGGIMSRR